VLTLGVHSSLYDLEIKHQTYFKHQDRNSRPTFLENVRVLFLDTMANDPIIDAPQL
jgi:hypothetical protein